MDFCSPHFGKPLNDLNIDDVTGFFATEKIETDQLEFKSFGGLSNENYKGITRTIGAFLNSKGGLLIWGAPIGAQVAGRNEKVFQGALTPLSEVLVKDTIISKVSDSITPLPTGIRVKVIEDGLNGCICIFEVDQSNYAPHQFERIYNMRIDGQTKPAPHHYVEALFKRISYPEIEGYLKFTGAIDKGSFFLLQFDVYLLNFSPLQNAEDISFRVIFDNATFPNARLKPNYALNGHEWREESVRNVLHYGEPFRDANYLRVDKKAFEAADILYGMLTFGAKNSPSKASEYRIQLNQIAANTNPETAVIERKENQLFKDIQERKGASKEALLKSLLER